MLPRHPIRPLTAIAIVGIALGLARLVRADGYYFVPKSYYVAPPLVYNAYPIYQPAPIIMYEPVPGPPPPVAGYYLPRRGPVGRVRETWNVSPHRARYRYQYELPNGVEYTYRYNQNGRFARFSEKWNH